ncbi:hypothetical protein CFC21_088486, partial [Triticum aestivum]
GGPPRRGER